ncbi:MAG: MipA/OmpV family protein [Pseudohongiella sp.]|nr:MipA/OmpV family protein [Pseudohongiella sp.]MDP2126776.1 MipA/OmpV family protein [Pseudohongiella sp.]
MAMLCLCVLQPVAAQEQPLQADGIQHSRWTIGAALGHGRRDNPFVASDDMRLNAIVDLAWYGERWFFDNGDIGFMFEETARFSANALITFDNERNYFSYLSNGSSGLDIFSLRQIAEDKGLSFPGIAGGEAPDLGSLSTEQLEELVFEDLNTSLPKRRFAVNSGLEMLYISAWGDLQAQLLTDVSGTHHGQSAWFSWSYPWITPTSEFSLTFGAEWKSSDLVDYYYGVRPYERIDGRPGYSGKAGVNGVVRVSASRALSERWRLVGVVEREYLSNAIRRSPIIERGSVNTAFLGLYYQFK